MLKKISLKDSWVLAVGVAALWACRADEVVTSASVGFRSAGVGTCGTIRAGGGGEDGEGEIYGTVLYAGEATCDSQVTITLTPLDGETSSRLPSHFKNSLTTNFVTGTFTHAIDWWDYRLGGVCLDTKPELTHDATDAHEGHCIMPGRYLWTDPKRSFEVDYLQPDPIGVVEPSSGLGFGVEARVYNSATIADLPISIDLLASGAYTETVRIDIDNSGGNPNKSTFINEIAPNGTASDTFRFLIRRSSTNYPEGGTVAKLYWDIDNNLGDTTRYFTTSAAGTISSGDHIIRLHSFAPPPGTDTAVVYRIGLELMNPAERPANAPETGSEDSSRTITIYSDAYAATVYKPDLAIHSLSVASGPQRIGGHLNDLEIVEKNLATNFHSVAPSGWVGALYLSPDAGLSPSTDRLLATYTSGTTIAPGGSYLRMPYVTIPSDLSEGTWYLIAVLDTAGTVNELEEGNNVAVSGPITLAHGPVIDSLVVGGVFPTGAEVVAYWGGTWSGMTIELQAKLSAASTWSVIDETWMPGSGAAAVWVNSFTPNTEYDLRARATWSGSSSEWVSGPRFLTRPVPTPSNFHVESCYIDAYGNPHWSAAWSVDSSYSGPYSWDAEIHSTTGSSELSSYTWLSSFFGDLWGELMAGGFPVDWIHTSFWLRYTNGVHSSIVVPLDSMPLAYLDCSPSVSPLTNRRQDTSLPPQKTRSNGLSGRLALAARGPTFSRHGFRNFQF